MKPAIELTCDDLRIPQYVGMREVELTDKIVEKFDYCSLKLDGNWTAVRVDGCGVISVWTRRNNNITKLVRHNEWYNTFQVYWTGPRWVFGELWKKDVPCSSISTYLAEGRNLDFRCFGVEGIGGKSGHTKARIYVQKRNIPFVSYIAGEPHTKMRLTAAKCRSFYDEGVKNSSPADGLVFSGYLANPVKWKPNRTIDLVYAGYQRGKGKYRFTVGNIILKTSEGFYVSKASGMSDRERDYIRDNDKILKEKVVEIKYKGVGEKGKLRHPSFVRFRFDKTVEECSVYQDMELAKHYK